MESIKVLIADDDPDLLEITAQRLMKKSYTVTTAASGEEALYKIRNESPDVILLDLMMPGKDGFEVLKEIRENPSSEKWQPVIIISTRGEFEDIRKGIELEAEHYLVKPCSVDDVIKAIRLMAQLIPYRKLNSDDEGDNIDLVG